MSVIQNTNNFKDILFNNTSEVGKLTYKDILDDTQKYMSEHNSKLFSNNNATEEVQAQMRNAIESYVGKKGYALPNTSTDQLVTRLFNDMVKYSFLEDYLYKDGVEEININAWDDVEVLERGQKPRRIEETFTSPQHAFDVVRRMLASHGIVIDNATPCVVGYLGEGVRICCFKEPIVSERDGVAASIRIVKPNTVSKDKLLDFGTAREDELDLLTLFINNGISVCAGGSTGSGKTTTLSYLLSTIDQKKRLLSMEEGSREFMLRKYNEDGTASNSVVSLLTRESDNDKQKVSLQKLVELAMRMDPEIVAVGEMRSEEAYEVSEVARTGHTVVSTIHSMSASATYRKMMTLAYKKYQMDTDFMMTLMVEAFPIIFFQKHLEDGSRKIVEVIEGMSYENGEVQYQPLYRFVTLDKVKDANGNIIEIKGKHLKLNNPSKALQERLLDSGVTRQELNHFLEIPIENVDKYKEYSECEGESDA